MTHEELKAAKRAFLDRYNCDPTDDEGAVKNALSSASQHNSLYREGVLEQEKNAVREYWTTLLREFAAKYESRGPISRYEADIEELKRRMNGCF